MPVYEYKCEKGHVFETIQSMADDPLDKCEQCGAPAQRVLYAPAVHFKGKGFYNTDYGTKKRQREMKSSDSKSDSASTATDSSTKSDSGSSSEKKPAKKSEGSSSSSNKKD
jgi:putative FmdB family regulatory protein